MSEELNDPASNTMAWQAWVDKEAAAAANEGERSLTPYLVSGVLTLLVGALLVYLLVG